MYYLTFDFVVLFILIYSQRAQAQLSEVGDDFAKKKKKKKMVSIMILNSSKLINAFIFNNRVPSKDQLGRT